MEEGNNWPSSEAAENSNNSNNFSNPLSILARVAEHHVIVPPPQQQQQHQLTFYAGGGDNVAVASRQDQDEATRNMEFEQSRMNLLIQQQQSGHDNNVTSKDLSMSTIMSMSTGVPVNLQHPQPSAPPEELQRVHHHQGLPPPLQNVTALNLSQMDPSTIQVRQQQQQNQTISIPPPPLQPYPPPGVSSSNTNVMTKSAKHEQFKQYEQTRAQLQQQASKLESLSPFRFGARRPPQIPPPQIISPAAAVGRVYPSPLQIRSTSSSAAGIHQYPHHSQQQQPIIKPPQIRTLGIHSGGGIPVIPVPSQMPLRPPPPLPPQEPPKKQIKRKQDKKKIAKSFIQAATTHLMSTTTSGQQSSCTAADKIILPQSSSSQAQGGPGSSSLPSFNDTFFAAQSSSSGREGEFLGSIAQGQQQQMLQTEKKKRAPRNSKKEKNPSAGMQGDFKVNQQLPPKKRQGSKISNVTVVNIFATSAAAGSSPQPIPERIMDGQLMTATHQASQQTQKEEDSSSSTVIPTPITCLPLPLVEAMQHVSLLNNLDPDTTITIKRTVETEQDNNNPSQVDPPPQPSSSPSLKIQMETETQQEVGMTPDLLNQSQQSTTTSPTKSSTGGSGVSILVKKRGRGAGKNKKLPTTQNRKKGGTTTTMGGNLNKDQEESLLTEKKQDARKWFPSLQEQKELYANLCFVVEAGKAGSHMDTILYRIISHPSDAAKSKKKASEEKEEEKPVIVQKYEPIDLSGREVHKGTNTMLALEAKDKTFFSRYHPVYCLKIIDTEKVSVFQYLNVDRLTSNLLQIRGTNHLFPTFRTVVDLIFREVIYGDEYIKERIHPESPKYDPVYKTSWDSHDSECQSRVTELLEVSRLPEGFIKPFSFYPNLRFINLARFGGQEAVPKEKKPGCGACVKRVSRMAIYKISFKKERYDPVSFVSYSIEDNNVAAANNLDMDATTPPTNKDEERNLCGTCKSLVQLMWKLMHHKWYIYATIRGYVSDLVSELDGDEKLDADQTIDSLLKDYEWLGKSFLEFQVLLAESDKEIESLKADNQRRLTSRPSRSVAKVAD